MLKNLKWVALGVVMALVLPLLGALGGLAALFLIVMSAIGVFLIVLRVIPLAKMPSVLIVAFSFTAIRIGMALGYLILPTAVGA